MKARYIRAMDHVHRACLFVAGLCLVVITVIIPWSIFTRFVLNSASSWPEPMAILVMIVLSFTSAVVCYREHLHIAVGMLPAMLKGPYRVALGVLLELCMLATNLFLLWFGIKLVQTTWHQSIAEFPSVSVGLSYLPVPIGGALTGLFVIERFLTGKYFPDAPDPDAVDTVSTE
ncbi:MAG: TRAP transporter small permease [Alphaproteobacteria bacterium]|nr:TRAP transporter small permease [Alphaproteobacteria bacterium]